MGDVNPTELRSPRPAQPTSRMYGDISDEHLYSMWGMTTGYDTTRTQSDRSADIEILRSTLLQEQNRFKELELKNKETALKLKEKNKQFEDLLKRSNAGLSVNWGRLNRDECPVCSEEWNDDSNVFIMSCCKNILHVECNAAVASQYCMFCREKK